MQDYEYEDRQMARHSRIEAARKNIEARFKAKPVLKMVEPKNDGYIWKCSNNDVESYGRSVREAYSNWFFSAQSRIQMMSEYIV